MDYYLALRQKDILTCATTWMNLDNSVLREISPSLKDHYCVLLCMNGPEQKIQCWCQMLGRCFLLNRYSFSLERRGRAERGRCGWKGFLEQSWGPAFGSWTPCEARLAIRGYKPALEEVGMETGACWGLPGRPPRWEGQLPASARGSVSEDRVESERGR